MAGRFFAGWGIGNLAMLAPLYQSEIAMPAIRGRLTSLVSLLEPLCATTQSLTSSRRVQQQFMLGLGAFTASWVGYGSYKNHGGGDLCQPLDRLPSLSTASCRTAGLASSPGYPDDSGYSPSILHPTLPRIASMAGTSVSHLASHLERLSYI